MSEVTTPGSDDSNTYQMLWDCRFCGAKKLLALDHRHCPQCGSPQGADARYFPSDEEKVAAVGHVFVGKDLVCRYCQAPNSRNCKHCGQCGSPLTEGTDAGTRATETHPVGEFPGTSAGVKPKALAANVPPKRSRAWIWLVAIASLVVLLVVVFTWKKEDRLSVSAQSWSREIEIQKFGPVDKSAWCDELPSGVQVLGKSREVRRHEQVKVGEDCSLHKVDQGDGTFREQKTCTPRMEDKPVQDDKCKYRQNEWALERVAKASGNGITPEPSWPSVEIGTACTQIGCRREGKRSEHYVVSLHSASGSDSECEFDATRWRDFHVGDAYQAKVSVVGSRVDCDSLRR
ncbi:MAG TPA: zinc ribbon domain-containing protein [Polyangiaceae bacterium]|jgi:hypothetical protein|nr:zinc ribbon domain-containing protein [Polyangiaceae bacterium]